MLVVCFGFAVQIAVVVQLLLGYVVVPEKNAPRPYLPLGEGWFWLVLEIGLGLGLIFKGFRGVDTNSWPPA